MTGTPSNGEAAPAVAPGPPPLPGGLVPPAPPSPPTESKEKQEKPPKDVEKVSLAALGDLCGGIYADVFNGVGHLVAKVDIELPAKRAKLRGQQMAVVLRKLGWEDDEILAYLGLAAGVAGDVGVFIRERDRLRGASGTAEPQKPKEKEVVASTSE